MRRVQPVRDSRTGRMILLLSVAGLVVLAPTLLKLAVEWLWFGEVGQRAVFWKMLATRWLLGLTSGLGFAGFLYLNLSLAHRHAPRILPRAGTPEPFQALGDIAQASVSRGLMLVTVVFGAAAGLVASAQWDNWLRFRHTPAFGTADPIFGQDLAFFVGQYPFLQFVVEGKTTALVLTAILTAVVYWVDGAIAAEPGELRVAGVARTHLSVLLGLVLAMKAGDFWLDRYSLVLKPGGIVFGAGYAEHHAGITALVIMTVLAALGALLCFANARTRGLWLPAAAVGLVMAGSVVVGGIYPSVVQRFSVAPDEQAKERPYIQHHLTATRRAYGLDQVQTKGYDPGQPLRPADLTRERDTLENIRLWDYRVLAQAFQRLQGLRQYYDVSQVDIDRYTIDGRYRQVMLSARELLSDRLQQRRWVNEKLQFTHGYGLVMSAVNQADPSGRPVWRVRELPLEYRGGPTVSRPQIYYGMREESAVVAPSRTPELDYPTGTGSQSSSYTGSGGISLGSLAHRALFAAYLGDGNLLISDQIRPNSRILIRRNVASRIAAVAPFLRYDADPYLVVLDGNLVWVQDAYTTASTYPYSEPTPYAETRILAPGGGSVEQTQYGSFNYLRNSVKATVDAYTGEVTVYLVDDRDPLARAYAQAFPGLFRPASEITPSLRAHLRYPEDLFQIQARKFTRFHVEQPDVFYARSDVWEIPSELRGEGEALETTTIEPYYVVMRLPGEAKEEFALILPYRTRAGTTMPGWLTARCDGERYGELRLYQFPSNRQVDAPQQVDSAIRTDREISPQITLYAQGGSQVIYGNLLVLPVGTSILYVKPLYLMASRQGGQEGIPELKQVILAEHRGEELKIVMRPNLREALAALVGGPAPEMEETTSPDKSDRPAATQPTGSIGALADEAASAFDAAEQALRRGDWAGYGREIQRARAAIARLRKNAGSAGGSR